MPNKETILKEVLRLRSHARYMEPAHKEGQIWGGKEYGVRFKVTKTGESDINDIVTLVARGTAKNRARLIDDFIEALGEPKTIGNNHVDPQTIIWQIK